MIGQRWQQLIPGLIFDFQALHHHAHERVVDFYRPVGFGRFYLNGGIVPTDDTVGGFVAYLPFSKLFHILVGPMLVTISGLLREKE